MKLFVLCALAYLVASVNAGHPVEVTIEECEDYQCASVCTPPREKSFVDEILQKELGCFCPCARKKGQACQKDGNCVIGLFCDFDKPTAMQGICKDVCKKPGLKCGIFDPCVVNKETGEPECKCQTYHCSNMHIGHGVCALDEKDSKKVVFNNDCKFVNSRCERRRNGTAEFTRLPIQDCAELIGLDEFANNPNKFGSNLK